MAVLAGLFRHVRATSPTDSSSVGRLETSQHDGREPATSSWLSTVDMESLML